MSMHFGPASSDPAASGLPRGEVLGTYDSYAEARTVVDRLAEQDFDVRTVSIVGVDLRTVERIRNRLTYATVALRSALQGAFFGLMLGILMSLIDPSGAGVQILYTVGLGIGIWMLFGVIGHAIRKGKGFDSVQQLVPTRFDVVCEFSAAGRARQILGTGTAAVAAAPAAPTRPDTPTTGSPAGPASGARSGGKPGSEGGSEDDAGPAATQREPGGSGVRRGVRDPGHSGRPGLAGGRNWRRGG
ncbi:MAG TPA: general stress protein [Citricoccus sp.]